MEQRHGSAAGRDSEEIRPTRVLLAEDAALICDAFFAQLDAAPDIEVVAQLRTGAHIEREAVRTRADVALLDVHLPGLDGLTAGQRLKQARPDIRVALITGFALPGLLTRALRAELDGVVLKCSPYSLPGVVRELVAGRRVIDAELTVAELAPYGPACPLTDRELEILTLTSTGMATGEVARHLALSAGTVRNYMTAVVTKLGARTKIDAVGIARSRGWLVVAESGHLAIGSVHR